MKNDKAKIFVVLFIVSLAVIFILLSILSPEGTAGLWRKIIMNILMMFAVGLIGTKIFMAKDNIFLNAKAYIFMWSITLVLACLISIPCIADFSSEHEMKEISSSSCSLSRVRNIGYRYYILLNTGEKIEISANTYFSLLGQKDCTLRIEYFPNTKTAVKISGYE